MEMEVLRILVDFGLLILIWMVQLIIYPSFLYYSKTNLTKWHHIYTGRITIVVFPLMAGQLAISIVQLAADFSTFHILYGVFVAFLWIITMMLFVPMHNQLSNEDFDSSIPKKLVKFNWIRTIAWSLLFGLSLLNYYEVLI
ncbi:MAG: hypothetical protein CMB99_02765 [Flavobacteriaceae bacterium]|nr:hypothetical protein [Flavobacteriaceae bacterium]